MSVWWCEECQIPLLSHHCEICGFEAQKPIARDLTPVFAEEMTLLRETLGFTQLPKRSRDFYLWASGLNYYRLGEKVATLRYSGQARPTLEHKDKLPTRRHTGRASGWCSDPRILIRDANRSRLDALVQEASTFITRMLQEHKGYTPVVPFSGGKDSLAVSILARRVMPSQDLLHVFSNTGLEAPDTLAFVKAFAQRNHQVPLIHVVPNVDFYDMCRIVGPPSRIKRWCCSTQKAFPLGSLYGAMATNGPVMSLCGVRRAESASRQKHERILSETKIADEVMVCPIIDWSDIEVWTFIMSSLEDVNAAYKKGFRRVGCMHCPHNSAWSEFLGDVYYPVERQRWEKLLQDYYSSRRPGSCVAVNRRWKVRAGGLSKEDALAPMELRPCDNDANSFSITFGKPVSEDFWEYFRPFGDVRIVYDDGIIGQGIVLGADHTPMFDVRLSRPRNQVRFTVHETRNPRLLSQRITRQVRKAVACIQCGVCQITCPAQAINCAGKYTVDQEKCVHCLRCVTQIPSGCVAAHSTMVGRG